MNEYGNSGVFTALSSGATVSLTAGGSFQGASGNSITMEGSFADIRTASLSGITFSGGTDATAGTVPTAIGQLCIVDASDAYVAARLSPAKWLGPLNS
jgi:hypothetical protein